MDIGPSGMASNSLQQAAVDAVGKIDNVQGTPGQGLEDPNAESLAKFQSAIQPPADAFPPSPSINATAAGAAEPASLGDRILQGMASASDKIQAGRSEAAGVLNQENVTQADLLRANFSMMESSTLVSAISKTTEKITQSVKTLQQG